MWMVCILLMIVGDVEWCKIRKEGGFEWFIWKEWIGWCDDMWNGLFERMTLEIRECEGEKYG